MFRKYSTRAMPLVRGSDSKGAFFCWETAAGKQKYYYAAGNRTSRERARARAIEKSKPCRATNGKGYQTSCFKKLGGSGYLEKTAAERHKLLDRCAKKNGYLACFYSVLAAAPCNAKITADTRYLKKKYGTTRSTGVANRTGNTKPASITAAKKKPAALLTRGSAALKSSQQTAPLPKKTGGARGPKPKKPTLSTAARSKQKAANRARVLGVVAYRASATKLKK